MIEIEWNQAVRKISADDPVMTTEPRGLIYTSHLIQENSCVFSYAIEVWINTNCVYIFASAVWA